MIKINPDTLIPFDQFLQSEPIAIDLVYADKNHARNIFQTSIYRSNARCWAHKDIAAITLLTARILYRRYQWTLEIKDCLRTIEAQDAMQYTDIVKANPQWMEPPRLLAPPGAGGHPRGMAIDVHLRDKDDTLVDMGTPFDCMEDSSARNYQGFSNSILENRQNLEKTFIESANALGFEFVAYSAEWWDFRFTHDHYSQFAPLNDRDLPRQMQMTGQYDTDIKDFPSDHFEKLALEITSLVDKAYANL